MSNPFDDSHANPNPFADPSVKKAMATSAVPGPAVDEYNPFATQGSTITPSGQISSAPVSGGTVPSATAAGATPRERELAEREAQLAARERELKQREADTAKAGKGVGSIPPGEVKNWPKFYPILHHDISGDIPSNARTTMRTAYLLWILVAFMFFWNMIANIVLDAAKVKGVDFTAILISIIAAPVAPFFALIWYRLLYNACRQGTSLLFIFFFCCFGIHCAAMILATIGVSKFGAVGVGTAIAAFKVSKGLGLYALITCLLWAIISIWSIFIMYRVIRFFRDSGRTIQEAQNQGVTAASGAVTTVVAAGVQQGVQQAATNATTSA